MPTKIKNKTNWPLDIWLSIGATRRWDNNVGTDRVAIYTPGLVYFTLNAKINSGPNNEIGAGEVVIDIALGVAGTILPALAPKLIGIAVKRGGVAEAGNGLHFKDGVTINHAEETGVYGRWDMSYEVHGGELYFNRDDPSEVTFVNALRFESVSEEAAKDW